MDAALARWFTPAELAAGGVTVEHARGCLAGADLGSWANALALIATFDVSDGASRIACPTLALSAELDAVSPPSAMAELAARIPGAIHATRGGAAHLSQFLRPAELAQALAENAARSS